MSSNLPPAPPHTSKLSNREANLMQENTILIKTVQRLKERANVLRQEKQHVELSLTQAQGDHERDMEKLYQETICGICLDPWCEPHILSPCGHVFCEACLLRFFQSTDDKRNADDDRDLAYPDDEDEWYLCPVCLRRIVSRPTRCPALQSIADDIVMRNRTSTRADIRAVDNAGNRLEMANFF